MLESRSKQRRGEKKRKKILKTALNLFSEKDYDKVTVDEIVKKSSTSKGSFYFSVRLDRWTSPNHKIEDKRSLNFPTENGEAIFKDIKNGWKIVGITMTAK